MDNVVGENQPIVQIDVASNSKVLGDKRLAGRTLTTRDFRKADEYQDFLLDFNIFADEGERDVEFRIHSWNGGYIVTLDYVELTKG